MLFDSREKEEEDEEEEEEEEEEREEEEEERERARGEEERRKKNNVVRGSSWQHSACLCVINDRDDDGVPASPATAQSQDLTRLCSCSNSAMLPRKL